MRLSIVVAGLLTFTSLGRSTEIIHPPDATLRAVDFRTSTEGWAVGDQGTVWSTVDGGKTWQLRTLPTQATLTSVQMGEFEDEGGQTEQLGFITGRRSLPFLRGSTGTIFRSTDGGAVWSSSAPPNLGGIQWLWPTKTGFSYAIGESSDACPSGIAVSTNRGATWTVLAANSTSGWTASLCINDDHVLLGDANGRILLLKGGRFLTPEGAVAKGSVVRDFAAGGGRIWAVGDKGFVANSNDSGLHWQPCELPLPPEASAVWDLRGVSAAGNHVWAVGRPGSTVLHSSDSGKTWSLESTKSDVPLLGIDFVDETHGWAVGTMGTILATEDGGRNWKVQQQGANRAGILWIAADSSTIPLTALGKLSADEGLRVVALALASNRADDALPGSSAGPMRLAEAVRSIGGATAETSVRFPLPAPETAPTSESILAHWRTIHGNVEERIRRELTLAIRTWQPQFVVTDERPSDPNDPLPRSTVDRLCREAVQAAADPAQYREQIDVLRLPAHSVPSLLIATHTPNDGDLSISPDDGGQRIPERYGVLATVAEAHLSEDGPSTQEVVRLRIADAGSGTSVSSALAAVEAGSPGRRRIVANDEQPAGRPTSSPPTIEAIAAKFPADPQGQFEQLKAILKSTNPDHAGKLFFDLSYDLAKRGRIKDAKAAQDFLIVHLPDHPLTVPAYRQLLAYQSGSEIVRLTRTQPQGGEAMPPLEKRLAALLAYASKMQSDAQPLIRDPMTVLMIASAGRQLHKHDLERGYLSTMASLPANHRARDVLDLEMRQSDHGVRPMRRIVRARAIAEPPYLDGKLDDSCWQDVRPTTLEGSTLELTSQFATQVRLRHDDEYLYVSASCAYPDTSFRAEPVPRTGPDADLAAQDRLVLVFDVDRDYHSFLELAVDSRGLVADRCAGEFAWNPKWFVATDRDEREWRVEIAIPLAELTDEVDLTRQTWAFNAIRIVPGHAVLGWSGPTTAEVRGEDCTLLLFGEHEAGKKTTTIRAN